MNHDDSPWDQPWGGPRRHGGPRGGGRGGQRGGSWSGGPPPWVQGLINLAQSGGQPDFGRGGHFYNFRGLQQYKDKFDPEWEPRYMAVPGGIALPMILANVASLIGGGLSGVVRR